MRPQPQISAILLASAVGVGGCGDEVRSCDLETNAIAMRATVTDSDEGVEVEVVIEVGTDDLAGGGTPLALCSDTDKLTVNGQETKLTRVLGQLYYSANFSQPATDYRVELTRNDFEDAVATVLMPPSLQIDAPLEGSEHARGDSLDVLWSPAWDGNSIELAVEDEIGSSCITGLGIELPVDDTGSYVVPANSLIDSLPGQSSTCEVWLVLTRSTDGEYPEQLHPNGSMLAHIKRRRPFLSAG